MREPLSPPNQEMIKLALDHQNQLTKPTGSLGDLESIATWLAGIQQTNQITSRPVSLLLFAADHPVSHHGVSAYPREVTAAMVHNILNGGAASSVLCKTQKIPLHLWDVGVDNDYVVPNKLPEDVYYYEGARGGQTGNLFNDDALDEVAYHLCLEAGRQAIDQLDDQTKIVLFGEMGIGNTTPAAALCGALLNEDAHQLVGAGTGVQGSARENKIDRVQQALDRCKDSTDPVEILRRLGGREIVAMASAIHRAAQKGIAVWVDGFIVTAAALAACKINPSIRPYLYFAHQSAERGHRLVLKALHAKPLIQCGLRLGEGTGALTAFPLLELAVQLHKEMATFAQASVPDRED